ncbi:MAG: hypothetical protein HFG51_10080 [Lachnospiraceae bacterium]|nr:hypothetical protein [Lachnospiraceae bacterium]
MSKIKLSGTPSESAVPAEKEFQLAKQQIEIKAGEALMREASTKMMEQRESISSDKSQPQDDQPQDTAQLSSIHRRPYAEETDTKGERLPWVLELAGKDWETFLQWWPLPDIPLPDQLQELSKLYLCLLESALKYAEGENLNDQLSRLDSLLAQKLNAMMEKNLRQLIFLLEKNGETAVTDSIRSSLYRQTAGRVLSPQAAHRLFTQESLARQERGKSSVSAFSSDYSADSPRRSRLVSAGDFRSSSLSNEGMIYQSSRKQNIRFRQVYHGQQNSWKEQISQRYTIIRNARKGIAENTFRSTGFAVCSGKELETANRFAAHLNHGGNLFQHPEIHARNDEVTGLLAAIMSIKGQVYAQVYAKETGETSSLALSLQKVIGKIVDHYLSQKGILAVYYHILDLYRQGKNPQKAIQDGQDYAYQQFREKQKNPGGQKSSPYSRESGFFRVLLKNLSPEKEFALGTHLLQKDWDEFLRSIRTAKKSSYSSAAERYSPWGILLDPESPHPQNNGTTIKILLTAAVILLMGILALVGLKFF